jgi:hypothetical protein
MPQMQVHPRIRPFSAAESLQNSASRIPDPVTHKTNADNSVTIFVKQESRRRTTKPQPPTVNSFRFDHVHHTESTQADVYQRSVDLIVRSFFEQGLNGCVFVYGQTGSGKTHTIIGDATIGSEMAGVLLRAAEYLYEAALDANASGERVVTLRWTATEVYNDKVYCLTEDLRLSRDPAGRKLVAPADGGRGFVTVVGQDSQALPDAHAFSAWLQSCLKNRATSATNANATSSRSHAVFAAEITSRDLKTNIQTSARLQFCDLAGSEAASATAGNNNAVRSKEGKKINTSLFALTRLLVAFAEKKSGTTANSYFRQSPLTRLLQGCIGGNCNTSMIVCVAPTSAAVPQTQEALFYGLQGTQVSNKAVQRNVVLPGSTEDTDLRTDNTRLKEENMALAATVEAQRTAHEKLQDEIEELQRRMDELALTGLAPFTFPDPQSVQQTPCAATGGVAASTGNSPTNDGPFSYSPARQHPALSGPLSPGSSRRRSTVGNSAAVELQLKELEKRVDDLVQTIASAFHAHDERQMQSERYVTERRRLFMNLKVGEARLRHATASGLPIEAKDQRDVEAVRRELHCIEAELKKATRDTSDAVTAIGDYEVQLRDVKAEIDSHPGKSHSTFASFQEKVRKAFARYEERTTTDVARDADSKRFFAVSKLNEAREAAADQVDATKELLQFAARYVPMSERAAFDKLRFKVTLGCARLQMAACDEVDDMAPAFYREMSAKVSGPIPDRSTLPGTTSHGYEGSSPAMPPLQLDRIPSFTNGRPKLSEASYEFDGPRSARIDIALGELSRPVPRPRAGGALGSASSGTAAGRAVGSRGTSFVAPDATPSKTGGVPAKAPPQASIRSKRPVRVAWADSPSSALPLGGLAASFPAAAPPAGSPTRERDSQDSPRRFSSPQCGPRLVGSSSGGFSSSAAFSSSSTATAAPAPRVVPNGPGAPIPQRAPVVQSVAGAHTSHNSSANTSVSSASSGSAASPAAPTHHAGTPPAVPISVPSGKAAAPGTTFGRSQTSVPNPVGRKQQMATQASSVLGMTMTQFQREFTSTSRGLEKENRR